MSETPASIAAWAEETFGGGGSNARVAARANEEMAELLRVVTSTGDTAATLDEAADVTIVLCRLAARCGGDLWDAVEAKMMVNRARQWNVDTSGHGYHVREKA